MSHPWSKQRMSNDTSKGWKEEGGGEKRSERTFKSFRKSHPGGECARCDKDPRLESVLSAARSSETARRRVGLPGFLAGWMDGCLACKTQRRAWEPSVQKLIQPDPRHLVRGPELPGRIIFLLSPGEWETVSATPPPPNRNDDSSQRSHRRLPAGSYFIVLQQPSVNCVTALWYARKTRVPPLHKQREQLTTVNRGCDYT